MKRNEQAFTLVELLVVIGIIAVLISILLPSLNKARNQAVMVQCEAQLKQIGLSMLLYVNDNKGSLPPVAETISATGVYGRPNVFPAKAGQPSYLGRYLAATVNFSIFTCPAEQSNPSYAPLQSTSYKYHRWIGGDGTGPAATAYYPRPYKLVQIHPTSDFALVIDGSLQVGQSPSQNSLAFYNDPKSESLGTGNNYHTFTTTSNISHMAKYQPGTFLGFKGAVNSMVTGFNNVLMADGSVRPVRVNCTTYTPAYPAWEDVRSNVAQRGLKW